jgi:hypothetical protein
MAAAITTTATTLEGQLLEVAGAMQAAELAVPEETRPDNVQILPDAESGTITVSVNMEAAFSASGGEISFTAVPYL